jgi:hypothetical protein
VGGKIQVSEETAELIRLDGKESWLVKRDSMVTAKGKGLLQTYWVEPRRAGYRVSFSENEHNLRGSGRGSMSTSVSSPQWDRDEIIDEEDIPQARPPASEEYDSGCGVMASDENV